MRGVRGEGAHAGGGEGGTTHVEALPPRMFTVKVPFSSAKGVEQPQKTSFTWSLKHSSFHWSPRFICMVVVEAQGMGAPTAEKRVWSPRGAFTREL